jgi:alkylation response protein AidB-like acyl-CoA dehydrogenase
LDLNLHDDDLAFRDEVRTWLEEHVPGEARPADGPAMRAFDVAWQKEQYDGGWAGIAWPEEYGGRGLSLTHQMLWWEQYAAAQAPHTGVCFVGNTHGGPTLIAKGSDAQKRRYLPRILSGDEVWCQGFSEPGAGSDLAGIRSRAVLDGDQLVVTGQKIWTSYADLADQQELLVRTADGARRHDGLTWVVCDMRTPGIEVRTIATMEGHHDLSEVFYDEVRIPVANVVGELGDGWRVAMSTLSFERGTALMADQVELTRLVEELIDEARGRSLLGDDEVVRQLATARAEVAAMRAMTYAGISRTARRGDPGPEGSMVRLYLGLLRQRVFALAVDLLGADGGVLGPDDGRSWPRRFLRSHASTIGGGTGDIQRDIIGTRVLGLPKGR